jgi:hypothetical protein
LTPGVKRECRPPAPVPKRQREEQEDERAALETQIEEAQKLGE